MVYTGALCRQRKLVLLILSHLTFIAMMKTYIFLESNKVDFIDDFCTGT